MKIVALHLKKFIKIEFILEAVEHNAYILHFTPDDLNEDRDDT